jgi:MoaA/NifB/PqqE/SkfB family radical SAM enzyme
MKYESAEYRLMAPASTQPVTFQPTHTTPPTPSQPTHHNDSSPLLSWKNWQALLRGRLPGQVVIQFTDQCNASCAQCGMRRENTFNRSTLAVDEVKRLLDSMAAQGIEAVSFTGGEPLLYLKPITECIRHARAVGIRYVRTGTNGFMFRNAHKPDVEQRIHQLADTLATSGLYTFWISIDSADIAVHEHNRGLVGSIAGIEKALPIFHQYGLHPSANLGINRYMGRFAPPSSDPAAFDMASFTEHFRTAFRDFYQYIAHLGFTIVNACYPMDFDDSESNAVYTATSLDDFVKFSPAEKQALFQAMYEVIPEFRHRLRIFTPRSALRALIQQYGGESDNSYACRGGIDFFFVDARDMNTYPCGFRGEENLGRFWHLDLKQLNQKAWCKQCDWECFRDPSELSGPLLDLRQQPVQLLKRFWQDREYMRLWLSDLQYYRACQYFNAMTPPNYSQLARFESA